MRYLFILFAVAVILPATANAQSNFKPGYIVSLRGDTTKGFIDYQEWNFNPASVQFKTTLDTRATQIMPADYQCFSIAGFELYERYSGPVSTDDINPARQADRDTSVAIKTVFLKVLQRGKNLTLYNYTDHLKSRYFIKETANGNMAKELVYRLYFANNTTVTDNTFTQQLFAEANKFNINDKTTVNRIQKAEYSLDDITKIIAAINHTSGKELKVKTRYPAAVFFAGLGANAATFKTSSVQTHLTPSTTSVLPLISVGVDILANPNTGKLVFRIEAVATQNKYKSNFDNINYPYYPLHYSFTQTQISLIPQIVYNIYNRDDFKFYISPGAQISNLSYSNESYYETYSGKNEAVDPLFIYRTFIITATAKAGIKINNRIDAHVSYQIPQTMTMNPNSNLKLSSIYAGLNYYFGK